MNTDYDPKKLKEEAVGKLAAILPSHEQRLKDIDARLYGYISSLASAPDVHNMYEILGALKFIRMSAVYEFDTQAVRQRIRLYEGTWKDGRHVSGGLLFSGLAGRTHYMLTPIQVYMLAGVYGFRHWICTCVAEGMRPMLPTEEVRDGVIWDNRRLVNEAIFFIPRKFGKTTIGAFFQFEGFFFGDYNFEGYCCANSSDQAKILFNMTKDLIRQADPDERRIRFTATEVNWRPGQPREGKIVALSAGGKTKDGLFAQYCSSDEYGSASYVKDHSDMASLVNVVEGSMGPRREPLTIHTTTAGNTIQGPFQVKLEALKALLREEVGETPDDGTDWQFSVILQPDEWEMDDEDLFGDERIWRKVNPHIGITVQPDFYRKEIAKSRLDPEKRKETVTKLFNVFQTSRVREWIKPDEVRRLQVPQRIDDLTGDEWLCFVGMDFSLGDDLHAQTYLLYNRRTGEFFADMDAWITESALGQSSVRMLYEQWARDGWLHVSPGATLQPSLPINRIIELASKITFARFGYDAYNAKQPINDLASWVMSMGYDPVKAIVPVSQHFGTYNPAVVELDYMVKTEPPLIHFSPTPLWPWEFGNCVLAISNDGMENRKPVKANTSDGCKVDNVQCLCTAIILYDQLSGQKQPIG